MSEQHSGLKLLAEKRFGPYFITQALGALNDNVFKNALVILFTYQWASQFSLSTSVMVNAAAVLFILPFFLFSAIAGQLADKYEKSAMIRKLKMAEIAIMGLATLGFVFAMPYALLFVLFLMGFQSAIFGPLKYGYLPQHLHNDELIGGNGLVETGTFIAILIGTIVGGVLMDLDHWGIPVLCLTLLLVASTGYGFARHIPHTPPVAPELKVNWNPFSEAWRNIRFMRGNKTVMQAVLGISWFWFVGAVYLAQIPEYAKTSLAGEESVATLFLTAFSVGIGLGAFLCDKLSGGRVEAGLVPIGALGLSLFGWDLYAANSESGLSPLFNAGEFMLREGSWRILIDAVFIGLSGGLFTIPLYALIQERGEKSHMSRLIAGLNIINALFMVVAGIFAIALRSAGLTIPELFLVTALINLAVAAYIFVQVPEFILRFIIWLLINTLYRIKPQGLHHIPRSGPCVLVCNHVSFVDALILAGYCKRNVRFVMYYKIFNLPIIGWLFRLARAIPIAGQKEDPKLMQKAFDEIERELKRGGVVCIFPEGQLTPDGQLQIFRKGIEKIIQRTPVPVVPMALKGLWGSWFSRFGGRAMKGLPRKFLAKIELVAAAPVAPEQVTANALQQKVADLLTDKTQSKAS